MVPFDDDWLGYEKPVGGFLVKNQGIWAVKKVCVQLV